MTINLRRGLFPAALVATASTLAFAGTASAAQVSMTQPGTSTRTTLFLVDASSTEANNVTVRVEGSKLLISDAGAPITSLTARCRIVAAVAECPLPDNFQSHLAGGRDQLDYRAPIGGFVDFGDDNDVLRGGERPTTSRNEGLFVLGGAGHDLVSFEHAPTGVSVSDGDGLLDGVPGEALNVNGFESYVGSAFNDRIFTSPGPDIVDGRAGDDVIAGGVGDDFFITQSRDGADDYHGGPGSDFVFYLGRTQGVTVAANDVADDGEPFERDLVRTNVENAFGTEHADRLIGGGAPNRYIGNGGTDRLEGAGGDDTLEGGAGLDVLVGDIGNDNLLARDNERDIVSCGADRDIVTRDAIETKVSGCESDQVGQLKLDTDEVKATVGKATALSVSWTHPTAWKELKSVELRVTDRGATLGTLSVDPAKRTVTAKGAIKLEKGTAKVRTQGKTVSLKPHLKFGKELVGRGALSIEVEATDKRGLRQPVVGAATLEVR